MDWNKKAKPDRMKLRKPTRLNRMVVDKTCRVNSGW